jgi:hypothetical protein
VNFLKRLFKGCPEKVSLNCLSNTLTSITLQ